ncbi:Large ribosomal subunit protein uL18 - like 5 [Theobroma cacao]|nr:Large ribosomal subunit protein uL18 - like 5 [Theobroma cacao]
MLKFLFLFLKIKNYKYSDLSFVKVCCGPHEAHMCLSVGLTFAHDEFKTACVLTRTGRPTTIVPQVRTEPQRLHHRQIQMVIPPPVRPPRITKFLKPYVLKMHFTNKYVSAQVIHSPTATVASSASSQEKALRASMESTRDVAAAAKIGKLLGERLLLKEIPAVSVFLKREQKYHGKVKAVIDSLKEAVIIGGPVLLNIQSS